MELPAPDTFIRAYINFVKSELSKRGLLGHDLELKYDELAKVLRTTSHLVKVSNVKEALSFCFYNAKLGEFFGIARIYTTSTPGKGSDVHKLLALAATEVFKKPLGEINREYIEKSVIEVADLIAKLSLVDRRVEENIGVAVYMLSSLVDHIKSLMPNFGVTPKTKFRAFSENQLTDYFLHLVGVPDLILEFEVNGVKKAIVVDWKTGEAYRPSITRDMHQLILYSILELIRLGYVGSRLDNENMPVGVLENYVTQNPSKLKVLPLVVYEGKGVYSFHPAFPPVGYRKVLSVEEFKWEVKRSIYATIYLLTRVVNLPYLRALMLTGSEKSEEFWRVFQESRRLFGEKIKGYTWYMYLPSDVKLVAYGKAGDHRNREGKWHWSCRICPYSGISKDSYDEKKDICKFYFAFNNGRVKDRISLIINKLAYKYRYVILAEKEKSLFLNSIPALAARSLGGLSGIVLRAASGCVAFVSNERIPDTFLCRREGVNEDNCLRVVAGKNKLIFGVYNVEEARVDYAPYIELCRDRAPCEREGIVVPYKPVLVAAVEDVPYPSLAINTFAKAHPLWDKIDEKRVCIRLVPISPTMRFSLINYIKTIETLDLKSVFVVEQNADLTSIDLRAIDAFHRGLTLYRNLDDEFLKQLSTLLAEGIADLVMGESGLGEL